LYTIDPTLKHYTLQSSVGNTRHKCYVIAPLIAVLVNGKTSRACLLMFTGERKNSDSQGLSPEEESNTPVICGCEIEIKDATGKGIDFTPNLSWGILPEVVIIEGRSDAVMQFDQIYDHIHPGGFQTVSICVGFVTPDRPVLAAKYVGRMATVDNKLSHAFFQHRWSEYTVPGIPHQAWFVKLCEDTESRFNNHQQDETEGDWASDIFHGGGTSASSSSSTNKIEEQQRSPVSSSPPYVVVVKEEQQQQQQQPVIISSCEAVLVEAQMVDDSQATDETTSDYIVTATAVMVD
jgi:hypothetical protein